MFGPPDRVRGAFYDPLMAKYWVRFEMPLMVEVDDESDDVTRVVTLPDEIHGARDDSLDFMVFDDQFVRHSMENQPYLHAWSVAQPRSQEAMFFRGPPTYWPDSLDWEEGFDFTEADERYADINPYGQPDG